MDLSLAVNYIPACACLTKVLVFMLATTAIPANHEVDGLFIMAAVLYLDRLVTRNIIFDANAILLAIFFANVHAGFRATSTQLAYRLLVDTMFVFWCGSSLVLLTEPRIVKKELDKWPSASRLVPVVLMLVIVVAMSHIHEPLEAGIFRCCRAVTFALMSFAWIYIVGVHAPSGIEYLKENSCQFVARLSPVLYAPPWIGALFSVGAISTLIAIHMRVSATPTYQNKGGVLPVYASPPSPSSSNRDLASTHAPSASTTLQLPPPPPPPPPPPQQIEEENIEELFRLAQKQHAARKNTPFMPSISEIT